LFKNDLLNPYASAEASGQQGYKYSYSELDEKGNLLLEIKYDIHGEIEEKDIYAYNNEGKVIEEISYLSEDEIAEHKTYVYNENGLLAKAFKHYADGSKDMIVYEYGSHGNLTTKTTMDSEGEAEAKEVYEWKDKNLSSKEVYEFDELILKETYEYDDKGNRVEVSKWSPDEENSRTEYFYNERNEIIKTLEYNNDNKLVSKTLYTYDEQAKLVKADHESVRSKTSTNIIYDERGNAIEQTETNGAGEINNKAVRKFNEMNEVIETSVIIDLHGRGLNQEYLLSYVYDYFND
jgi:hypothetical protein